MVILGIIFALLRWTWFSFFCLWFAGHFWIGLFVLILVDDEDEYDRKQRTIYLD